VEDSCRTAEKILEVKEHVKTIWKIILVAVTSDALGELS